MFGLGMAARVSSLPTDKKESVIAIAGPLMNFLIAGLCYLALFISSLVIGLAVFSAGVPLLDAMVWIMILNVVIGVFNLIPMFPLDGGRVFRGILSHWMDHAKATKVVCIVAIVIAVGLMPVAIYFKDFVAIGVIVFAIVLSWIEMKSNNA